MTASEVTVGEALTRLLNDVIPAERVRKSSLEARALAVITSSGAFVSLLLALGAFVTKATSYAPNTATLIMLTITTVLYTTAAGVGIYCNVPGRYFEIEAEDLRALAAPEEWAKDGAAADAQLALARVYMLEDWRQANELKARWLVTAAAFEVAGILTTAAAVIIVLASA